MRVDEVLTTHTEGLAPLNRPIMLVALSGWFDASAAATTALEWLLRDRITPIVASIDPDPFYDFTQERPEVWLDSDEVRQIRWPTNDFRIARMPGAAHDLVVLAGVEPHTRWGTYCDCITTIVEHLGCEMVVTIGAHGDTVPHSRVPNVIGSSTDDELIARLGLTRPQYQGVTGVIGVMQTRFDARQIASISLRVGVPHYLGNAQHPKSSMALLRHVEHVLGLPPAGQQEIANEIDRWQSLHDEAVAEDSQASEYVQMLERQFDHRAEADLPSGDDLAAELESFLRDHDGGDRDGGDRAADADAPDDGDDDAG